MNAKRSEAILSQFPNVSLKDNDGKVKFTQLSLNPDDIKKLTVLDKDYKINIKRSGNGLVIIVD